MTIRYDLDLSFDLAVEVETGAWNEVGNRLTAVAAVAVTVQGDLRRMTIFAEWAAAMSVVISIRNVGTGLGGNLLGFPVTDSPLQPCLYPFYQSRKTRSFSSPTYRSSSYQSFQSD